MYIRILLLMFIFNYAMGIQMTPYFATLIVLTGIVGAIFYILKKPADDTKDSFTHDKNPLELKIASVFTVLFVFFSFLIYYTLHYYGNAGLNILSYISGFTDIDPFLLNLFQGKFDIPTTILGKSAFQAIISNNILKIIYTVILGEKRTYKIALVGIGLITLVNIIIVVIL